MPFVQSVLGKAIAAAARFAPQLSSRVEARLLTNHAPIAATPTFHDGGRFLLWVAVAPSHSPKQLAALEFTERARELAALFFGELPFQVDYSGSSLCRYVVPPAGETDHHGQPLHTLWVHPDGRVLLQWSLATSPMPDTDDVQLSLDEMVAILGRMYHVGHHPAFAAIHAPRRFEKAHRLDWRVGVTPYSTIDQKIIYWRQLTSSTGLPLVSPRAQNPSCPPQGFAATRLQSVNQRATASETFSPALEEMLVDAGYTGRISIYVGEALGSPNLDRHVASPSRGPAIAAATSSSGGDTSVPDAESIPLDQHLLGE